MTIELIVIWSLVVWRVTVLLVYDGIMSGFRKAVGVYYDEFSEPQGRNFVARALCCHRCTSIWVAVAACLFIQPALRDFVPLLLAFSAGSIVLNKIAIGE